MLHFKPSEAQSPDLPPASAQNASGPTSRLKKRSSYGWPLTPSTNSRGGTGNVEATPDVVLRREGSYGSAHDTPQREPHSLGGRKSFTFEFQAPENIRPSQPRPRSTMSSLKTGSIGNTSRPGSPSISHSNGSTAPILPSFGEPSPHASTRNKLVKRSSSQRALSGSSNLHSTLRRPATSHQRSATLHRQYFDGKESLHRGFHSSPLPFDLPENHQSFDDVLQRWRPFFKSQSTRHGKDGSSRKRNLHGGFARHENPPTIVPDITELPTLLLATSISTRSSTDEANTGYPSNVSAPSRPFTPVGLQNFETPIKNVEKAEPMTDLETRPRTSLSMSEIFPSPSPLTWKFPRVGSLRKNKGHPRNSSGRRVVSAPQSTQARALTSSIQKVRALGNHTRIYASPDDDANPSRITGSHNSVFQRSPSSPLPPLNRLSAFEVNLPDTVPSYPTSPQPEDIIGPTRDFSVPSSPSSSPLGLSLQRNLAHHPSGTHSDHASTLLESDHDNSRVLSGDEDDMDGRSETLYDSARTGATGSSFSRNKRPHIDTIFDESPPPELPSEDKLLALKHLRVSDSVKMGGTPQQRMQEKLDSPMMDGLVDSCKDLEHPASTHRLDENLVSVATINLPPAASPDLRQADIKHSQHLDAETEESWSFDDMDTRPDDFASSNKRPISNVDDPNEEILSRSRKSTPRRRESPPPNPFEWSEKSATEKDSAHRDSPRPKTVHGRQGKDLRGSRLSGRRGPPALHLRSQSVPVPHDNRSHSNTSKLDSWVLGNKGPSEDWDGDFDFEEQPDTPKPVNESMRPILSSGMLVPRAILERQASVHGQFGQVKELTKLVEELKRLQQQARSQGIMSGQSAELWKEAEGIINLATLDDEEQDMFPPHSPIADFDFFDEDSPSNRRQRSDVTPPRDERPAFIEDHSSQISPRPSYEKSNVDTPSPTMRPRKESSAKAKSVLENIHQQRTPYEPALLDAKITQTKLPFDTTSLKDLVTRAGVVTRALKEEVRRAENRNESPAVIPDLRPGTPPDPPFSQMFQKPRVSPALSMSPRESKSPRVTQSPKSPKSPRGNSLGGSITGNDNEINGHMKMMTVV